MRVLPVVTTEVLLRDVHRDRDYSFSHGEIYSLNSDRFVSDHGDVTGLQVVNAFLSAVTVQ